MGIICQNHSLVVKFTFSEKAKKICAIFLMVFDTYLVNVKTMRKIAKIFVALSEKMNFIKGLTKETFSLWLIPRDLAPKVKRFLRLIHL